ncbi:MAG: carboxylesterase [Chloroflexi bacterium HGW-Chloroflexi-4]|nr:MAG: carboxylesterase [Chloroflexi bacterium HGW-Chloroflexi-4]
MTTKLIIPTAEPFFIPGGKIGCLLIHGFTGTPKEMRNLADSLTLEKYTILGIRLAGHATDLEDMRHSTWRDWLASVEDGINLLKGCTDQQVIMGLSMGGVLSLLAAARYDVKGVVTFSAPCALPPDPRAIFLPYMTWLVPQVGKGKPDWRNLEAMKNHVDYPAYPTRSVLQLKKLIDVMVEELPHVKVPALLVQSRTDHGIPAESLEKILNRISSTDKSKLWVENSGHVIIREPEREMIFTEVKKFIKRITQ